MIIIRLPSPNVDEKTVMYRNPLGKKKGTKKIATGAVMLALAALLAFLGVLYILNKDSLALGIVLSVAAAAYIAQGVMYIVAGARLKLRPYSVIVDGDNLIIKEKTGYVHLPLKLMRRLTIDCRGLDAYLSVNPDGQYDVLIKDDTLYYTIDGVQCSIIAENMQKIAFVLNCIAVGGERQVNWGEHFEDVLASAHAEIEGATSGLNHAIDAISSEATDKAETAVESGATEQAEETNETANAEETKEDGENQPEKD